LSTVSSYGRLPITSIIFSCARWNVPASACSTPGFRACPEGKTLESEWGLALHIESTRGGESGRYLLDLGFTPDVYANNLDLMKIDPAAVDALILSHGHLDRYGGLVGFLEARRAQMRKDLRLYTGGEDDFCYPFIRNPDGSLTAFGVLDRRRLRELNVEPVLSEDPIVIEGHASTTGIVPRVSIEHVLPNTLSRWA
jgi:7,8-dihydropterin-6-yl-methyl-4-(beta-D-ribofuranosyl)aminobenzene 5'-phosphate synthase